MEDPQNSKNDISTFAGRMVAFSKLFGRKEILIGVDEIELGTDFEEAASLYGAMIEQLISGDVKMIITTHHKRLAMLLAKDPRVELLAALYDEKNSAPKYEFLKGTIGKSYAFETALRYGIAQNLIAAARKNYGENKENLNEAISKAINLELELKQKLAQTQQKEEKLDALSEALKDQRERVQSELKAELSRLQNEYYRAISEAKRSVSLSEKDENSQSGDE